MTMTDPIADMLTRIRNAIMAGHSYVVVPGSKMKLAIARILKDEGFIENYDVTKDHPQPMIRSASRDAESIPVRRASRGCSVAWASPSCPRPGGL